MTEQRTRYFPSGGTSAACRALWLVLAAVVATSFAVLGYYGWQIYQKAPPLPAQGGHRTGEVLFTGGHPGRPERLAVHGRPGGRHGLGPRRPTSRRIGRPTGCTARRLAARPLGARGWRGASLRKPRRAEPRRRCASGCRPSCAPTPTIRATGDLVVSPERAGASRPAPTTTALFGDDGPLDALRDAYAIPARTACPDPARRKRR